MSQVNMFRFKQKAMLDLQQTQEDERRDHQRQNQARFPQQAQQQPSPPMPSQPIRLANPTNYHIQQSQLRAQKDKDNGNITTSNNGAPPTPSNSFTNTIDPSLLSMGQFQYQQQFLHQAQAHHFAQQQQNQIKQESNSPDFSSSDMEYNENGQNGTSLLSPISASPINSPPNDFDGPDDFSTHPYMRPIHPHAQPQHPYGESPNAFSPGHDGAPEFLFENEPFSVSTTQTSSVPVPVRGGPRFFDQQSQQHPNFSALSPPQQQFGGQSMPNSGKGQWFGSMESSGSFPGQNSLSMQQMFEKRKRRRESHNAVERRRRDNINEKIQELSTLLPEATVDGANKPNKGAILRKSVDHIKSLQSDVVKYQFKIRELEAMLDTVRNGGTLPPVKNNNGKDKNSSSPVMQAQQGIHPLQQHPQHQNTILMAGLDGSTFINVNNGIALQNGGSA